MQKSFNILPEQRRRYRFAVTPLADAMFQLLIFFMLSSNLTPYTLLPLKSAKEAPIPGTNTAATGAGESNPRPAESGETAVWIVEANAIEVGGQRFEFDSLAELAGALVNSDKAPSVILIVNPTAHVQDVATVLAGLKAAGIEQVKISGWG